MRGLLNGPWLLACLVVSAPLALAQTLPPSLDACSTQSDDAQRLACYDHEVARLRQHPAAPASTSAPARPASSSPARGSAAAPVAAIPPPGAIPPPDPKNPVDVDRFGLTPEMQHQRQEEGRAPKELAQIVANVAKVRYKVRGELVIELDNGQTWEQAEMDGDVSMKPGESVLIKAGALHAYYLKPRVGRIVRVRRVH